MRLLDAEMDLREATRSTEQAHDALATDEYVQRAEKLAVTQDELFVRMEQVIEDIINLPDGAQKFGRELKLLSQAAAVMHETSGILREPDTGPEAIAAETEVIELLLDSKRANPNGGGGGGGSSPGGGGGGDTDTPALALYGAGADARAQIEYRDVRQSTGTTSDGLPAEYRDGLEAFFNAIEQSQ